MRIRVLLLAGMATALLTGAAAPGCTVAKGQSSNGAKTDACHPGDQGVPDANRIIREHPECLPKRFTPPGTGQAAIARGNLPGTVHVIIFAIDSADARGQRMNLPCSVITIAAATTPGGVRGPAIDTETGLPFVHYDGITTPDVIRIEVGAGVSDVNSVVTCAGGVAGQSLTIQAQLDGRPYGRPMTTTNPLRMGSAIRVLTTGMSVDL